MPDIYKYDLLSGLFLLTYDVGEVNERSELHGCDFVTGYGYKVIKNKSYVVSQNAEYYLLRTKDPVGRSFV